MDGEYVPELSGERMAALRRELLGNGKAPGWEYCPELVSAALAGAATYRHPYTSEEYPVPYGAPERCRVALKRVLAAEAKAAKS